MNRYDWIFFAVCLASAPIAEYAPWLIAIVGPGCWFLGRRSSRADIFKALRGQYDLVRAQEEAKR